MSSEQQEFKGIPKLSAVTYSAWKRAIVMALMSERCLDIVQGKEKSPQAPEDLPTEPAPTAAEVNAYNLMWERYETRFADYKARFGKAGMIINQSLTLESEIYVKDTTNPAKMWRILEEKLDSKDNVVLQRSIRRDFQDIKHDGKEPIESYIRKLREFQRALEGTPDEIKDEALMSKILLSLPASWETKIAAVEDDEDLTLDKLERVLRNYQCRLNAAKAHDVALSTRDRGGHRGRGKRPRERDRENTTNRVTDGRVSKDTECYHCLQKGHMQMSCPLRMEKEKRRRERNDKEKANVTAVKEESSVASDEKEIAFMVKHYLTSPCEWVLDSGATGHMCCSHDVFESLVRLPVDKRVYMGDGSEVSAYGVGTVRLSPNLVLKNVLYVPDFTVNLCSVSTLAKDGFSVTFEDDQCTISENGEEIIRGNRSAGLYTLRNDDETALVTATASLWHRRLGHLNMASVKKLETMSHGMSLSKDPEAGRLCSPCMEGKQHRVFNRHEPSERMTKRLQMVHSDTCGPFRTPSKAGAKTFVLFTDDMTRMVWCFFMKSKTETAEAFKTFKALTEKHSGESVMRFRCDNGKAEYDNATFQAVLRENGITYEPSAPYTQNQNGVSERMNRTIMEKARTMLLEAHLPESFWAEAVNTAVYLHNRSPTRSLDGKTPYEAWNGVRPDLSHIKVFGCDAYLFIPDEKRGKLQAKSQKCVLMGYVWNTTKMWRLWDPTGRRVVIGSNVKFDEGSLGGRERIEILQEIEKGLDKEIPERPAEIDDGGRGRFQAGNQPVPMVSREGSPISVSSDSVEHATEDEQPRQNIGEEVPTTLRRSTRVRTQTKMFPGMRAFAARVGKDGEPVTLTEALMEEPLEWNRAVADELKSHMDNGTWTRATLPAGKKALNTKWIFKFKTNADGSRRYKARLVVRGFEQREGIDFEETFAPVAKFTTVRIMLALATHFDWEIEQMDVKTAFLYPEIEEEVYIRMPEGYKMFYPQDKNVEGVARLVKTLYGLRQSPLAWFKVLDRLFRSKGFSRSNEDPSLYISKHLIILVFVDDIVLFSKDKEAIRVAKGWLSQSFKMVDLGGLTLFLGMQITRDRKERTLFVGQERYAMKILERCKMEACHGCKTPMNTKLELTKPREDEVTGVVEYQSLVGSIMYAMLGTRPDLAYAVSTLSKFNSGPGEVHHGAAKRVLRYLKETKDYGLSYQGEKDDTIFPEPICYTDSDWAGETESRKSTGGYVFIMGGAAISWKTKKQTTISLSSTEAEYVALSEATKEAMWMKRLLREIETRTVPKAEIDLAKYHEEEIERQWKPWLTSDEQEEPDEFTTSRPQKIMADNQGCIKLAENVLNNSRAKHIEIRYHYVRDMWARGKIELIYEPTATMTADVLTKALPKGRHWEHVASMGVTTRRIVERVGA